MEIITTPKRDYNMENYQFRWMLEADRQEIKVRLSIFTIISVCAGLPALVWSVSDLIHHRKNGHRISVFIILLLLTDFVELFYSPYILLKYILNESSYNIDWTIWVLWSLWLSSRLWGLLLNQLVAVEGILSVIYPLYTASVFSSPCFIIFYILVYLCILIGAIFWNSLFFIIFILFASVIPWIISCGASCSADRHYHTSRKPDHHILIVFIFNLLVFYLPFILFHMFISIPFLFNIYYVIPYYLMSVRLISDPLLCVLVCRQNLRIQTSQNPEESSLV